MVGLIVLTIISVVVYNYYFKNSKEDVNEKKESTKTQDEESIIRVLQIEETKKQEEIQTDYNEIHVYVDKLVQNETKLFESTMEFVESYIYPKKEFQRISIEKKKINEKAVLLIHTDSNEMYFVTFNEKFRVVALKKKMVAEPFLIDMSNKTKYNYFLDGKDAV